MPLAKIGHFNLLLVLALVLFFSNASANLFADELPGGSDQANTVPIASGGLASRERASLERQYQYQVRQKGLMMNPYLGGSSGALGGAVPSGQGETEDEKLYRYAGRAIALYKEGRLEEASEVMQYILDKDPDNEYIKSYLRRTQKEISAQKKEFKIKNKIEAYGFKKSRIENLIKDGIAYYDSRDFDRALLKFSDVLALDPGNQTAAHYMSELKKLYSREINVENIVQGQALEDKNLEPKLRETVEKLLDNEQGKDDRSKEETQTDIDKAAKKLLDDKNLESLLADKRAEALLNGAELEDRIKDIINAKNIEEQKAAQFTLGPGDLIQISVLDHPELSGKAVIELSGDVILPLVNEPVMARGLTAGELSDRITEALKRYVKAPAVTVSIIEYKSKLFYVIDEDSCTPYPITRSYLTLRDALFISDWGNNRALGRVLVIKPSMRHPITRKVDAFDLIFRGNLENNIRIEDGDVIYIPLTMMAKITKTVYDTTAPFRAIRNARDEFLNLKWNQKDWRRSFAVPKVYEQEAQDAQDLSIYGNYAPGDFILRR